MRAVGFSNGRETCSPCHHLGMTLSVEGQPREKNVMRMETLAQPPSSDSQSADPGAGARQVSNALVASAENLDPLLLDRVRERGHLVLRIAGGSMGPWLVPGDLLVVRRVAPRSVRRGNVVVFLRNGLLIAHRVISVLGAGPTGELNWKTKGDSAEQPDPPVFEKELVGRVTSIERDGQSFSLESPSWVTVGWVLAHVSLWSRFWYPIAHVIRRFRSQPRWARPQ